MGRPRRPHEAREVDGKIYRYPDKSGPAEQDQDRPHGVKHLAVKLTTSHCDCNKLTVRTL